MTAQADKRTKAFYICGTHWDREWYEPFQEFRMWLVQMLDDALAAVRDDERLGVFHLDGQVVLIEDYLEIRPEKRSELLECLASGRFLAGPWYVQPDEWLVSGEALIRNLALGRRMLKDWGVRAMAVGYLPDMFGHISAMPTLLAGFGVRYGVVWRGANDSETGCPFDWIGPDGSRLLTHKLPDNGGYGWFAGRVRDAWRRSGRLAEVLVAKFRQALDDEMARIRVPVVYLSDAGDHRVLAREAPEMLDLLRREFPEVDVEYGSIEDYFRELETHRHVVPGYRGELRRPARDLTAWYHALIPHCLSSRYPLKQRNDRCQSLLTLWAEPMAAYAALRGAALPSGYLSTAWKWLLKNHPHDSICGCSVDATHADMGYRFHQAEGIGDALRRQAMARLGNVQGDVRDGPGFLAIWNPLPWARSEVLDITLPFPSGFTPKGPRSGHTGPLQNQFEVVDARGTAVPCQIRGIDLNRKVVSPDETGKRRTLNAGVDLYHVALPVELPPAGATFLRIRPVEHTMPRAGGSLQSGPGAMENAHLRLEFDDRGGVRLLHKGSGVSYDNLFVYEDGGDAGDGWVFVPPAHDRRVLSRGRMVTCSLEEEGPHRATLRIDRTLRVPVGLRPSGREARSDDEADLAIVDRLTLRAGDPCLHVTTEVNNTARDHRLRVLFPTGIPADHYWADHPFDVVRRPVATDPATLAWKEADPVERPHHSFVAIEAENRGLALLCPEGLHEHSMGTDPDRTLGLTLFRSFADTPRTDGEPGAQVQGLLSFRYALFPFDGPLRAGFLFRRVAELRAGVQTHLAAEAPAPSSALAVEGPESVVVSAVKPGAEEGTAAVRLWNSGTEPADADLHLDVAGIRAWLCDLDEQRGEELAVRDGSVGVRLPPGAIVTVLVALEEREKKRA